jgi:predicted GIY-YIG superfamily endonuclease
LAYGLFVAVILTSLVLLLVQGRDIRRQGSAQARSDKVQQGLSEQIVRQGDQLETLLDNRETDRAERAIEVAAAVKELTKVQQAQLIRHDADVSRRLQIILDELGKLQDPPRVVRLPDMTTTRKTAAPTTTAPRTVAPAPRPAPCAKAGQSGRCKK